MKQKKIPEEKKEEVPQNFLSQLFNFFIIFTNGMFNLLNNIVSSPTGIIWGILFLLAIFALKSQAAEIPMNDATPQNALEHFLSTSNSECIVYGIDTSETYTFVTPLKEVEEIEFNGINDACEAIPNLHKNCKNHPASCQSAEFSL